MIPTEIINLIKSFLIKCPTCKYYNIKKYFKYCSICQDNKLICVYCLVVNRYKNYDNYECHECYYNEQEDDGLDIIDWLTF